MVKILQLVPGVKYKISLDPNIISNNAKINHFNRLKPNVTNITAVDISIGVAH